LAATVELGGRLTEKLGARCMTAGTDHTFAGPDQQIGGYKPFAHADQGFMEDVIRLLSIDGESWLGKFAQWDKWSFCLRAATMAARQENR
jgi:hypothetical protein